VQYVQCDVTNWEAQVAAFKAAVLKSPSKSIDIVVANAGISGSDGFFEGIHQSNLEIHLFGQTLAKFGPEDGEEPHKPTLRILETNLLAMIYTSKLAMHYMKRQDPSHDRCLILKSSIMGYLDTNGSPTYGAAKHGVRGLMKVLRRRSGLRVNVVAPWYVLFPRGGSSVEL
jgi:NAD(P)-dependent dehydrogenase (short-subunit alcohol dehydrogenase family)